MKYSFKFCLIFVFLVSSVSLHADGKSHSEYIKTGRYSAVLNEPTPAQDNILKVVINTEIPAIIGTVGDAVRFLLLRSGYSLAPVSTMTTHTKTLLRHNIPEIHRKLGPMTLDRVLNTLAGQGFVLLVDPLSRKVSFTPVENVKG